MSTYTAPLPTTDDPQEHLRARLHALELANATLHEALRLAMPYVERYRPPVINEPLCDSEGCIACCETRAWRKALERARQALGEEVT
jgi:hypothetical protein